MDNNIFSIQNNPHSTIIFLNKTFSNEIFVAKDCVEQLKLLNRNEQAQFKQQLQYIYEQAYFKQQSKNINEQIQSQISPNICEQAQFKDKSSSYDQTQCQKPPNNYSQIHFMQQPLNNDM
ncbi:hypothetical protein M9Y10_010869 [Tritrichomonas musculus]|uniref:Uncharacterized protein n=1 Tax=Tritrichomonas musculus TaxID=1915356 RepID=A0ABR2IN60_9EUKA